MANYRVTGMSTAQVKELQTALGVKADGAWGSKSQAALERAYGSNADARSVYIAGGGSSTYGKTGGFGSTTSSSSRSSSKSSTGSSKSSSSGSSGVINTNRTYKVNGQVVGTGSSVGGNTTTYGNGSYGGKYLGSNQTAAYQNMVNAPGSTGYEKGSLTLRVQRKDEDGNIYYEDVTRNGVLPLGTSFTATGAALADAQGVPESSGIFAYAKGRTPGYIEHASGYTGMGYVDAKGNFYDANGNYIREDGFYYEPGAAISKNGMYQDTGSGMGYAGYGVWGSPGNYIAVKSENYGKAPGTRLETFTRSSSGTGRSAGAAAESGAAANANAASPYAGTQTQAQSQTQSQTAPARSSEYEDMFAAELRRYLEALSGGYGM